jgi:hypothetical protein
MGLVVERAITVAGHDPNGNINMREDSTRKLPIAATTPVNKMLRRDKSSQGVDIREQNQLGNSCGKTDEATKPDVYGDEDAKPDVSGDRITNGNENAKPDNDGDRIINGNEVRKSNSHQVRIAKQVPRKNIGTVKR